MENFSQVADAARAKGVSRVVVAQAADDTVLSAVEEARRLGIAESTLVGDRKEIVRAAESLGIDLSHYSVVQPESPGQIAAEAVLTIARGEGDVLMKGMLSTAELLHAVLEKDSGVGRGRILSHVGAFALPRRPRFLFVTDAAMVIAPTLQQKAEIIQNAVDLALKLGIDNPIVAAVCALETVNPAMPATLDAACLSKMAERGEILGAQVEGPLALDNAVSVEAAHHKGIKSSLAGRADILLCPDIEAANILYKALIFFGGGEDAGIVVGAQVPIVVTSRAETAKSKLNSILLAAAAR